MRFRRRRRREIEIQRVTNGLWLGSSLSLTTYESYMFAHRCVQIFRYSIQLHVIFHLFILIGYRVTSYFITNYILEIFTKICQIVKLYFIMIAVTYLINRHKIIFTVIYDRISRLKISLKI